MRIPKTSKDVKSKLEFGMLISIIKNKNIQTLKELKKYIDEQINFCRNWLAINRFGSTVNRLRREYTKKLEIFTSIKKIVNKLKWKK